MPAATTYEPPLHGDVLEAVLSRVPASAVSKGWRDSVESAVTGSSVRARPWLFVHVQNRNRLSKIKTHAYDPYSRGWVGLPLAETGPAEPLRVAQPGLLYSVAPTAIGFSTDPFKTQWVRTQVDPGLQVWRRDPAVALVGGPRPCLVAVGGGCDFEDDANAVEVYDVVGRRWDLGDSLPERLKGVSGATWQAVAKDRQVYVLERGSGGVSRFDVDEGKWGPAVDIRPDPTVFRSSLAVSGDRLVLIGVSADAVRLWAVDYPNGKCERMGEMPAEMFGEFTGEEFPAISCLGEGDFLYVFNEDRPQNVFSVDISNGCCNWEVIRDSPIGDVERMGRILLTCSRVTLSDVRTVSRLKNRGFRSQSIWPASIGSGTAFCENVRGECTEGGSCRNSPD